MTFFMFWTNTFRFFFLHKSVASCLECSIRSQFIRYALLLLSTRQRSTFSLQRTRDHSSDLRRLHQAESTSNSLGSSFFFLSPYRSLRFASNTLKKDFGSQKPLMLIISSSRFTSGVSSGVFISQNWCGWTLFCF